MNEPSIGPTVRIVTHHAAGVAPPSSATRRSADSAKPTTGRVEASAMMTTTNKRLGVVDRVVDVVLRGFPAGIRTDHGKQHDRPQAEHHFDLAEKVQDFGGDARGRRLSALVGRRSSPVLHPMGQCGEPRSGERVENRDEKDQRRERVQWLDLHPGGKLRPKRLIRCGRICLQRARDLLHSVDLVNHPRTRSKCQWVRGFALGDPTRRGSGEPQCGGRCGKEGPTGSP